MRHSQLRNDLEKFADFGVCIIGKGIESTMKQFGNICEFKVAIQKYVKQLNPAQSNYD